MEPDKLAAFRLSCVTLVVEHSQIARVLEDGNDPEVVSRSIVAHASILADYVIEGKTSVAEPILAPLPTKS